MTPFITRLGFRAGALCSHQLWNQAMQVISPDDQILKHFTTNDKILTPKKYKSDFKKYRKSEGELQEYLNWDLAARESRPCGQVSCFWFLPEEAGRVYAHPLLQVQVQYMITISSLYPKTTSFITRLGFREGAFCSHQLAREDMSWTFTILAIVVLDVNFTNPYKTADFLFFDDKEDAKKTNNNVVKGCLIHAHEDINNLSPFPSWPATTWSYLCRSWEKAIIVKIIQPKSKLWVLFSSNSFSCASNTRGQFSLTTKTIATICSAAIPFPARQNMCAKSCKELQQRRLLETGRELPHRK